MLRGDVRCVHHSLSVFLLKGSVDNRLVLASELKSGRARLLGGGSEPINWAVNFVGNLESPPVDKGMEPEPDRCGYKCRLAC